MTLRKGGNNQTSEERVYGRFFSCCFFLLELPIETGGITSDLGAG